MLRADISGCAGAVGIQHFVLFGNDFNQPHFYRFFLKFEVDSYGLGQIYIDVRFGLSLISDEGYRNAVWTSNSHVTNVESAAISYRSSVSGATWFMDDDHIGADEGFALSICNQALHGACGYSLCIKAAGQK